MPAEEYRAINAGRRTWRDVSEADVQPQLEWRYSKAGNLFTRVEFGPRLYVAVVQQDRYRKVPPTWLHSIMANDDGNWQRSPTRYETEDTARQAAETRLRELAQFTAPPQPKSELVIAFPDEVPAPEPPLSVERKIIL